MKGWRVLRLRRLMEATGGSWGTEPDDGEVVARCIRGTDFHYGFLRTDPQRAPWRGFTAKEFRRRSAQRGDLIIEKSGGGEQQPVGRIVLHDDEEPVVPTNFAGRLRPEKGVDSRFLCYLMASLYSDGRTTASIKQTTGIQNLDLEGLLEHRVRVPVPKEQRLIADFLDAETARIDALIAKKQALYDLARQRLVSFRRQLIEEAATRFGEVPLRRCVECLDASRIPLNRKERSGRPGPYPYWGAGSVVDHLDDYLFDEELVLVGEDGAPFFDDRRDVAFWVNEKVWVNNHIHVLRPRAGWTGQFLVHCLNAVDYGRYITGSTRDKLTQGEMDDIRVPNAPVQHQRNLTSRVGILVDHTGRLGTLLHHQIALLHERRQALITAAVTGKLDIPGLAA